MHPLPIRCRFKSSFFVPRCFGLQPQLVWPQRRERTTLLRLPPQPQQRRTLAIKDDGVDDVVVPESVCQTKRNDPTTKRPNRVCDPFQQGGKPLDAIQVQDLLTTLHQDWRVQTTTNIPNNDCPNETNHKSVAQPVALIREFYHTDFLVGSRFLQKIAAVAELNAHFPTLQLQRQINQKKWITRSSVRCHTLVLGGLSRHDFHLALVRCTV